MTRIRANGKLLLTGEYAVLDGAKALAIPTKLGQTFDFQKKESPVVVLTAKNNLGEVWFQTQISTWDFEIYQTNNESAAVRLQEIFRAIHELGFRFDSGLEVMSQLEFPNEWGLGSSSTLIYALANYFGVNAYDLLQLTFGGSGYDIACASTNEPIVYQRMNNEAMVSEWSIPAPIKKHLFFVYSNRKQNSREGIERYRQRGYDKNFVSDLGEISEHIIRSSTIDDWCEWLNKHEQLVADFLHLNPIKELYFQDFPGTIKSLGAWGGDFFLAVASENPVAYFKSKGFDKVFSYGELILDEN